MVHYQRFSLTTLEVLSSKFPLVRNTIQETTGTRFPIKISFYKKQNLDFNFILFLYIEVKCYLKAKRDKNMKKHFIEVKNHS